MTLRVQLLGPFRVWFQESALPDKTLNRKKVRSVFKMLALHPEHRLQKDRLIEELWAELEPEQGAAQLYNALYNLRKAFQPFQGIEVGLSRGEIVLSAEGGVLVDALDFEKTTLTALKSRAFQDLLTAVNLWTGDFSPEDLYDDWSEPYRMRFTDLRLQLLLVLGEEALQQGNLDRAQQAFSSVLEVFPASEGAHLGLMRICFLLKNRDHLIKQHERYTTSTFEELGEGPAKHVQEAFESMKAELEKVPVVLPQSITVQLPGRAAELEQLHTLHQQGARLITIVGMGGQGKTRLAHTFSESLHLHSVFISAAQCKTLEDLLERLRLDLQVKEETASVLDVLLSRGKVLLVLDNVEQVLGLENWLQQALDRLPELTVVCTSRRTLNVPQEKLLELQGLRDRDAIDLFCSVARKTRTDFVCTPQDQEVIRTLCQHLGGSPLGIELAAGWVRLMEVQDILNEMQEGLDFLDAGTPKSLMQVLKGTWERLNEHEQEALKALSTFAEGFTVLQAKNTFQIRPPVLLSLSQLGLVNKQDMTLSLHPLIRQLARSHLPENSPHLEAHARHHLEVLSRNHLILNGADRPAYLTALEHTRHMMPDVLLAMQYSQTHLPELFMEACPAFSEACLFSFLSVSGLQMLQKAQQHPRADVQSVVHLCLGEMHVWLGDVVTGLACIEKCDPTQLPESLRFRWYLHRGLIAERKGQFQESLEWMQQGLSVATTEAAQGRLYMQMGDAYAAKSRFQEASEAYTKAGMLTVTQNNPRLYASWIMRLGTLAGRTENWSTAEERFLKAIEAFKALEDTGNLNRAINNLSMVYLNTGRYEEARDQVLGSLARARLFHSPGTLTALLNNLSVASLACGDLKTALESSQESLKICRESGFSRRIPSCLLHLADIHLASREPELARMVHLEARPLFQGWNPLSQLDNLMGAVWASTELGDVALAEELLQEAEPLVAQHPSRLFRFLATRAHLQTRTGHPDGFKTVQQALKTCHPTKDVLSLGWLLPAVMAVLPEPQVQSFAGLLLGSQKVYWLHKKWAAQIGATPVEGGFENWLQQVQGISSRTQANT